MKTLVIARYNEPLDWLPRVPEDWRVIVVNKGAPIALPASCIILDAPNEGREGATFLNAIKAIQSGGIPSEPADLFAFFQGKPEDHAAGAVDALAITPGRTGFREFGRTFVCDGHGKPHHWDPIPVAEMYEAIFERKAPNAFRFIVGGQFMVTAEVIQGVKPEHVERCLAMCTGHKDGPWVMERLWLYLFGMERE